LIVQRRYVGEVDPGHGERAALVEAGQSHRYEVTDRSEEDRGVQ
jgi:hypothetical protein